MSDLADQRYILFRANIAADLVKVVLAGKQKPSWGRGTDIDGQIGSHQTTQLVLAAAFINNADLERLGLPPKYLQMIHEKVNSRKVYRQPK